MLTVCIVTKHLGFEPAGNRVVELGQQTGVPAKALLEVRPDDRIAMFNGLYQAPKGLTAECLLHLWDAFERFLQRHYGLDIKYEGYQILADGTFNSLFVKIVEEAR